MEKLYYISQGASIKDHLTNIETVCKAGVGLVQLRLKQVTDTEYLKVAEQANAICKQYQATLIINDAVGVAKQLGLGVHLGKSDTAIVQVKRILKTGLIGGTANTLEDCLALINQNVDYIGLGPYAFTATKKKLSHILGIEGYKKIMAHLTLHHQHTPIYAIGGITQYDVKALVAAGVYGVAVSGLLSHQNVDTTTSLVKSLKKLVQ